MPTKISTSTKASHLILPKTVWVSFFLMFLITGFPILCPALELEPRRWNHLPLDTNFAGIGFSYTEADIYFDPVLRIEDATLEMNTLAVKYIRTFELFNKSARIDFIQGFQDGRWNGLLDGAPASISRSGLMDSILRLAINLYGAPPLGGKDFVTYRSKTETETIVGSALAVHLPTGIYMNDKLINLGTNRYTLRPQFGILHNSGKWSWELTGSIWLYTDNTDFYNGNNLKQDPLYTMQTHLVYTYRPGVWLSGSFGYSYGAETTLNEKENDDLRENLAWMISLGYPITNHLGIKIAYIGTRTQQSVGQDSDSVALGFSLYW